MVVLVLESRKAKKYDWTEFEYEYEGAGEDTERDDQGRVMTGGEQP